MDSFGKRMAALRKERSTTQDELAKQLSTSTSVIGRYERDEMVPSIEVAKNVAALLDTTVGYLIGEAQTSGLLKEPAMLQRLQDIANLPEPDRNSLLLTIDNFIKATKLKAIQ